LPAAKAPGCKTTPGEPGLKNKSRFQPALFSSRGVYASARSSETSEFGAWAIALPNLIKNQANLTPRTQRSKGAEVFLIVDDPIYGQKKAVKKIESLRLLPLCPFALRFFKLLNLKARILADQSFLAANQPFLRGEVRLLKSA